MAAANFSFTRGFFPKCGKNTSGMKAKTRRRADRRARWLKKTDISVRGSRSRGRRSLRPNLPRPGMRPSSIVLATRFLDGVLEFVHFLLRVEEAGGDGIFQQRVAVFLKGGDFRRFQRLAAVLFFLERLAFAHQGFILAARAVASARKVSMRWRMPPALELFQDGCAKLVRFRFNFGRHKCFGRINHIRRQKQMPMPWQAIRRWSPA